MINAYDDLGADEAAYNRYPQRDTDTKGEKVGFFIQASSRAVFDGDGRYYPLSPRIQEERQ